MTSAAVRAHSRDHGILQSSAGGGGGGTAGGGLSVGAAVGGMVREGRRWSMATSASSAAYNQVEKSLSTKCLYSLFFPHSKAVRVKQSPQLRYSIFKVSPINLNNKTDVKYLLFVQLLVLPSKSWSDFLKALVET